jgi:serine/tyrosine/threonine adenylyltransferase
MYHLDVPTSRAASLIVSDKTTVKRDPLYSGNVIDEKCAVVMRVAPTFMRFGSFEIFMNIDPYTKRQGPSFGLKQEMMGDMLDYLMQNFYPKID